MCIYILYQACAARVYVYIYYTHITSQSCIYQYNSVQSHVYVDMVKFLQDAHDLIDLGGGQELHKARIRLLQLAELSGFLD